MSKNSFKKVYEEAGRQLKKQHRHSDKNIPGVKLATKEINKEEQKIPLKVRIIQFYGVLDKKFINPNLKIDEVQNSTTLYSQGFNFKLYFDELFRYSDFQKVK